MIPKSTLACLCLVEQIQEKFDQLQGNLEFQVLNHIFANASAAAVIAIQLVSASLFLMSAIAAIRFQRFSVWWTVRRPYTFFMLIALFRSTEVQAFKNNNNKTTEQISRIINKDEVPVVPVCV